MARFPLALPAGIFRNGTQYQAKGRWYDAWGTRWYGAALGPIKGWKRKGTSTLTGLPRAAIGWRDNAKNAWIGIGTHSKLYVCNRLGAAFDITPTAFTSGLADATASGGYGSGPYGASSYGTPRSDTTTTINDATQWTLDTWGQDLVGVSPDDRKIYEWVAPNTGTIAARVTNSPLCDAVAVTAERFVFALGTDLGTDNPRAVSWCDQENNTVWTPSGTNQAGSFPLQTAGRLMCGVRVKGGTLLLTSADAFLAQYIGGTLVYGFDRVSDAGGVISRQGAASFGQMAAWMGPDLTFWQWNGGAVVPLNCDVLDYIRLDINLVQKSKIVAVVNAANFEIEWRYCSGSSTEIDRCIVWQYRDNYWTIGRAARTCGVDMGGLFPNPILISSDGKLYDHELGWAYDAFSPYAKSGPIELGNGDKIAHVLGLYPDDATVGDVTASFTLRRNPDDPGTNMGPYSLTEKTDLRFSGGQIEVTVTGSAMTDWRVGVPKLELIQGEARG
jgi:hypothetical protein